MITHDTLRRLLTMFTFAFLTLFPVSITGQDSGAIRSGETLAGSIEQIGEIDTYNFYGEAGEGILIVMTRRSDSVSFSPYVELYDPQGFKEETGLGRIDNHRLEMSGLYTIVCHEFMDDFTGDYSISLLKIPGPLLSPSDKDGGDIRPGRVVSATIMPVADTDGFHFYGNAGDSVIINMTRTSQDIRFGTSIELYDPTGLRERTGLTSIQNHRLVRSGLYTIVCREFLDDFTGSYNLSLTKIPSRLAPGLYSPSPGNGDLIPSPDGQMDWADTEGATAYDVYFGQNVTTPLEKIYSNLTTSTCSSPSLTPGVTYYWKIIAKSNLGVVATGPVWMFSVENTVAP